MRVVVVFLGLMAFQSEAFPQSRSGVEFQSTEIRELQKDDAANPGMQWVDRGAALWGQQCASCHKEAAASMKGVAARYPVVKAKKVLNLEGRINECRVDRMKQPALAYESEDLLSLTAFVAHQSRDLPIQPDPAAKQFLQAGKNEYFRRRGQLNLACTHCHDANWGKKLGPETLSQGQPNGYPAYRLEWQHVGSLHRRLRACFFGLRAEMPPAGSELLLSLELYLADRARGLPIESPAVRR